MRLSDAIDQIRTGDVLLFRGTSFWSWLIKLRTKSVYSHAGIVQRVRTNGHSRVCIIESLEPFGVRLFPLERYVAQGEHIDWFQLDDKTINPEKVADYAMAQWGAAYALTGLWWSFTWMGQFLRRFNTFRKLSARLANRDQFFCSQLVAAALENAGFKPDEGLVPIETDPGAVARITCLKRQGTLEP